MAEPGPADELMGTFARMSGVLLTEATVSTALATLTSLAADTIPASTGAGISLLDERGTRTTSAATDALVAELDDLQYELDEGPCLTAWRERTVVRSGGPEEQRWPEWLRRSRTLGLRSYASAALLSGDDALGAIKVYSTEDGAYDDRDVDLLRRFALQAAIFVANVRTHQAAERLSEGLKETLRARDLVATARGIIMARNRIGPGEAFQELIAESHRSRRPLHEVATSLVASATDD